MEQIPLMLVQLTSCTNKFTSEEIAQAEAQYQEWLASQPTKEEQIAKLQEQIDALKGT